jgi:hypothetical protein
MILSKFTTEKRRLEIAAPEMSTSAMMRSRLDVVLNAAGVTDSGRLYATAIVAVLRPTWCDGYVRNGLAGARQGWWSANAVTSVLVNVSNTPHVLVHVGFFSSSSPCIESVPKSGLCGANYIHLSFSGTDPVSKAHMPGLGFGIQTTSVLTPIVPRSLQPWSSCSPSSYFECPRSSPGLQSAVYVLVRTADPCFDGDVCCQPFPSPWWILMQHSRHHRVAGVGEGISLWLIW